MNCPSMILSLDNAPRVMNFLVLMTQVLARYLDQRILKKPQLNVSDVVSPKVEVKLALKNDIRSRREKQEVESKKKTFKNQAKFLNKRNFEKPYTAKAFQNHTTVDGSCKKACTVTKSTKPKTNVNFQKDVKSLSQNSLK